MCPSCPGVSEDAEHVFLIVLVSTCYAVSGQSPLRKKFSQSFIEAMLLSEAAWQATSAFATEVLQELRRCERKRSENKTRDISTMEE